jgi:hypothetical protein
MSGKKRYQLTALNFKTTKEVMPYVDKMFDVFNKSYASLSSVAITDIQKNISRKIHRINQPSILSL